MFKMTDEIYFFIHFPEEHNQQNYDFSHILAKSKKEAIIEYIGLDNFSQYTIAIKIISFFGIKYIYLSVDIDTFNNTKIVFF